MSTAFTGKKRLTVTQLSLPGTKLAIDLGSRLCRDTSSAAQAIRAAHNDARRAHSMESTCFEPTLIMITLCLWFCTSAPVRKAEGKTLAAASLSFSTLVSLIPADQVSTRAEGSEEELTFDFGQALASGSANESEQSIYRGKRRTAALRAR